VNIFPQFEDENVSEMFSAEMEFRKIGPRRLSSRVWKSCVSVDTGSSPLSSWFSRLEAVEAGEMRKLEKIRTRLLIKQEQAFAPWLREA
jgi:hypothetical protein